MAEITQNSNRYFDMKHLINRTGMALAVPLPQVGRLPSGKVDWNIVASNFPGYLYNIFDTVRPILNHTEMKVVLNYRNDQHLVVKQAELYERKDTTNISSLWNHEKIQDRYIDVLCQYEGFRKLLGNKPKSYLHVVNYLHDAYRFAGNSKYPLTLTEGISGWFVKKIVHQMFDEQTAQELLEHIHTMDWITGKKPIPDFETATNAQIIARIIKVTDTLSKMDETTGDLSDPDRYFEPGGTYDRWKQRQREYDTLPIYVTDENNGRVSIRAVSLEQYAEQDRFLVEDGIKYIESITGVPMHEIWLQVRERMKDVQ